MMFTGILWLIQILVALLACVQMLDQALTADKGIDSGTMIALVLALWAVQWAARETAI